MSQITRHSNINVVLITPTKLFTYVCERDVYSFWFDAVEFENDGTFYAPICVGYSEKVDQANPSHFIFFDQGKGNKARSSQED